jgi:hypothetical protein
MDQINCLDELSIVDNILRSSIDDDRKIHELCKLIHLNNLDDDKFKVLYTKCCEKLTKNVGEFKRIYKLGYRGKCEIKPYLDINTIDYWEALLENKVQTSEDFLVLPEKVNWISKRINKIYIRECYKELYEIIKSKSSNYFSILGTPGIGKTCFGLYCMYRLLEDKKNIVYQNSVFGENVFIYFSYFTKEVYITNGYSSIVPFLNDKKGTIYVCDAVKPIIFEKGTTILVTSTRREIYKNYHKFGTSVVRYMPVWTLEELMKLSTFEEINESFRIIGGIPRQILEKDTKHLKIDLESAIFDIVIDKLAEYDGSTDEAEDVRSLLLHIIVDDDYEKKYITFASKYIKDKLYDKFVRHNLRKFGDTIKSFADRPGGSLLGELFENYIHKILPRGHTFEIKELKIQPISRKRKTNNDKDLEQVEKLTLTQLETKIFRHIEDIDSSYLGKYSIPYVSNFSSIDSLIIFNDTKCMLFQITIGQNHPIKQKGLNSLIQHIDKIFSKEKKKDIEFYFVVPNNIYDVFKRQSILTEKLTSKIPERILTIKQYALCIDLEFNLDND